MKKRKRRRKKLGRANVLHDCTKPPAIGRGGDYFSLSLSLNNGVVALNRLKGWRTRRRGVSFRGNGSLASPHLI